MFVSCERTGKSTFAGRVRGRLKRRTRESWRRKKIAGGAQLIIASRNDRVPGPKASAKTWWTGISQKQEKGEGKKEKGKKFLGGEKDAEASAQETGGGGGGALRLVFFWVTLQIPGRGRKRGGTAPLDWPAGLRRAPVVLAKKKNLTSSNNRETGKMTWNTGNSRRNHGRFWRNALIRGPRQRGTDRYACVEPSQGAKPRATVTCHAGLHPGKGVGCHFRRFSMVFAALDLAP